MNHIEWKKEINDKFKERLELVIERIREIATAPNVEEPYVQYFKSTAEFLLLENSVYELAIQDKLKQLDISVLKELNDGLFGCVRPPFYENGYLNPAYASKMLGKEMGQLLSAVAVQIRQAIRPCFDANSQYLCLYAELFVEIYNLIEEENEISANNLKTHVYSFMHDYLEVFQQDKVENLIQPKYNRDYQLLMESDLENPIYLYQYGLHVSKNEIESNRLLNRLSEEELNKMASTFTEGYRMGFEVTGKDLSKKSVAEIRYPIGFEAMVRVAVENFRALGLEVVLKPFSASVNKQYEYDHKEDEALWLDKALVERGLEVYRQLFEKRKEQAAGYAGPAVIEVFGEEPFSPTAKCENCKFSEKQQSMYVYQKSEFGRILNHYIKGEERSFTIIAFPIYAIGEKYEEIFRETIKINTLDYQLYQTIQQKIIDELDQAKYVHVRGKGKNRTDLKIAIMQLENPQKETAFENCVADVNIPVGEVFTTPVLQGTNGILHVSSVYLNDYRYENLEITFCDGKTESYSCTNFSEKELNQKYIEDNILMHHKMLPMGEFAIGTNTTAYKMAKDYDISDKLPILIAEKTGPHFAVGDTCYTYDEDNITYNPDGKAIVARENEISALRKTDLSAAYFNCHTDITIPYHELDKITVVRQDGERIDIISDGRFVLPGTEILNEPLNNMNM